MKKLRVILPAVAFVMAIVTAYASIPVSLVGDAAKGINSGTCSVDELNNNRTIGSSAGQCNIVNEFVGVCTVTFPFGSPTTAFTPSGSCDEDDEILYIQQ